MSLIRAGRSRRWPGSWVWVSSYWAGGWPRNGRGWRLPRSWLRLRRRSLSWSGCAGRTHSLRMDNEFLGKAAAFFASKQPVSRALLVSLVGWLCMIFITMYSPVIGGACREDCYPETGQDLRHTNDVWLGSFFVPKTGEIGLRWLRWTTGRWPRGSCRTSAVRRT